MLFVIVSGAVVIMFTIINVTFSVGVQNNEMFRALRDPGHNTLF